MPKRNQIPLPVYGSPEWKAERAQMVGTPEWKAAHNYDQNPNVVTQPGQQGAFIPSGPLIFTPAGKTLTTAEKQAQNPLYNPLYDPGSAEYKENLVNASNPNYRPPVAPPNNLVPNPNIQSSGPSIKPPVINTQPLQNAYANQNSVVPQYTPPTAGPTQIPTQSGSQYKAPQIQMPQMFQQNYSMGGPSARPPTGIQMPNFSSPLQGSGSGTNWSDLLSVAHNRYQR